MPMKYHRHQASDMVRKHSTFKRKESESYRDGIKYFYSLCKRPLARLPQIPTASFACPHIDHLTFDNNGRPTSTRHHQRRLPRPPTLLQSLHAAKPRAPTSASRLHRPIDLASHTANRSAHPRHPLSTPRATQPHPPSSTSRRQVPLLRHPPPSPFDARCRRPTDANARAAAVSDAQVTPYIPFPHQCPRDQSCCLRSHMGRAPRTVSGDQQGYQWVSTASGTRDVDSDVGRAVGEGEG